MSRSGFFKKVLGKAFLGGKQVDFLSWLCFVRCLLLTICAFFYIVVSYLGGALCYSPTLAEIRDRL